MGVRGLECQNFVAEKTLVFGIQEVQLGKGRRPSFWMRSTPFRGNDALEASGDARDNLFQLYF